MENNNNKLPVTDTKLQKAARLLAKISEVAHWIGAVGCVVGLVLTLVMGADAFTGEVAGVKIYGFEVETVINGQVSLAAVRLELVAGCLLMGLMAMVCRNVFLILKNSKDTTPFTPDNVRMVREIGIFFIAMPVAGLVMEVVSLLVLGWEVAEVSMDLSTVFVGLVMLCLSQFFARGMALEGDVDGLV